MSRESCMKDPIGKLVKDLVGQGVVFEVVAGELRWASPRGIVTSEVARLLVDHAPIVVAILYPILLLPNSFIIPRETPNDVAAITRCVDAQRRPAGFQPDESDNSKRF